MFDFPISPMRGKFKVSYKLFGICFFMAFPAKTLLPFVYPNAVM